MFSGCNTWPDGHIAIPEWAIHFKQHRDHEMDPQTDRAMQELAQLNMLYLTGADMLYLTGVDMLYLTGADMLYLTTGGGDSMCYAYHEKLRRFLPWAPNSILKLYTGAEFFVQGTG
jgi:hypothetical protein